VHRAREEHVGQLIDFALEWGGQGPMVVHCWAGISRSTAAPTRAVRHSTRGAEELIALRLREASPTAYPNRLIIRPCRRRAGAPGSHGASDREHRPGRRLPRKAVPSRSAPTIRTRDGIILRPKTYRLSRDDTSIHTPSQ